MTSYHVASSCSGSRSRLGSEAESHCHCASTACQKILDGCTKRPIPTRRSQKWRPNTMQGDLQRPLTRATLHLRQAFSACVQRHAAVSGHSKQRRSQRAGLQFQKDLGLMVAKLAIVLGLVRPPVRSGQQTTCLLRPASDLGLRHRYYVAFSGPGSALLCLTQGWIDQQLLLGEGAPRSLPF